MADIFLSYAHIDRPRARPIVELLESEGWTVWWDRGIEPGTPWEPELEKELARSRAVVTLWSKTSWKHRWVLREAKAGLEKGALVPILLDRASLPKEFKSVQATDLSRWRGEAHLDEVQVLLRRLANLVPPSRIDSVRPGYNVKFLGRGRAVPLPGVTGPAVLLRYLHFTVVMNPGRRLAHYVAYNIDGRRLVRIPRQGDKWVTDPLLPEPLQMDMLVLRHSGYDRGALGPRATVSWGKEHEAFISARQASFLTNIAPQHPNLNRRWWLSLEDWEREVSFAHKQASGFCGPIFSEADNPVEGEMELGDGLVAYNSFRVPRAYWKVIAAGAPRGGLEVAAFLMDQFAMQKSGLGWKINLADYRVSLRELETVGRLHFCDALHAAKELRHP